MPDLVVVGPCGGSQLDVWGRYPAVIGLILKDTPAVWGAGMTCGSGFQVVLTVDAPSSLWYSIGKGR